MDVIFSAENRKVILHIPVPPEELDVTFPHNNMTVDTANGGQLKIIGKPGIKAISFSSWVPVEPKYTFLKSNVLAFELKEFFVKYKRTGSPIRIVLTYKNGYELHNELYAIDEFTFGYNRVGDMTYSLKLESLGGH